MVLRLIFMALNGLFVEEAYYWNYGEHLDFGYFDHPPMVGLLIKASVVLLGIHDFSVHLPALICWALTAFFLFKWTELIARGAGQYAVMLFSVLPFFFLQSVVTTPDPPVMVCWAAALYYLYRTLVLDESRCWYVAGIWLGLGLLSKYTMVLLALPLFLYVCIVPTARPWFFRKEPYVCALITLLLFSPVIYWNATHEWASFAFQSIGRFGTDSSFSTHKYLGLLLFVMTPVGLWQFGQLFQQKMLTHSKLAIKTQRFLQLFTLIPIIFFGMYSLRYSVKFDWVGPGLLAILPWFAVLIKNSIPTVKQNPRTHWFFTAVVLLLIYAGVIAVISWGVSETIQKRFLTRYFSWRDLTEEFYELARRVELETGAVPWFSPLDTYNISSEFSYYQAMLLSEGKISKIYPVVGRHIFNLNSLMYQYWFDGENLSNKTLILISTQPNDFEMLTVNIKAEVIDKSSVKVIWSHSQRAKEKVQAFYYKIVQMKPYDQLRFNSQ